MRTELDTMVEQESERLTDKERVEWLLTPIGADWYRKMLDEHYKQVDWDELFTVEQLDNAIYHERAKEKERTPQTNLAVQTFYREVQNLEGLSTIKPAVLRLIESMRNLEKHINKKI